jgi:hypothetical protein
MLCQGIDQIYEIYEEFLEKVRNCYIDFSLGLDFYFYPLFLYFS